MKKLLIIGCGYVGKAVAQFYQKQNWEVTGWVRSEASAKTLKSLRIQPYLGNAANRDSWQALPRDFDLAIYCAAAGRQGGAETYREVYLQGITCAAQYLSYQTPLIFTSSTSVYPQSRGEWVTETSLAEPITDTGKILRAAENIVLARKGTVLRLAGIYGPGRQQMVDRLKTYLETNEKVENRWINHIFLYDIVTALVLLSEKKELGVYNGCDNLPVTLYEVLAWLCQKIGKPLPAWINSTEKILTHKRVSNAKLREMGWLPAYPTYQEGYAQLLD